MINSDFRFPLFDNILFGGMHPNIASNRIDAFLFDEEQRIEVQAVADKGAYSLVFFKPLNDKCRFYYQRLIAETYWYCNELLEEIGAQSDTEVRAYWRLTLLDRHLKTLLIKTGEEMREHNYPDYDFIAPPKDVDNEKLANSYVFHLLKVCLAKAYLEFQNTLGATPGKQMDEATLYTALVGEMPPVKCFIKKRPAIAGVQSKKPDQFTTEFKPETKAESSTGAVVEKILSIKELSGMKLGDERTIRRWIEKGEIKGFKLGKKWFVTETELNHYLEKSKAKTKKTEI